jgi:hypothetical protein
MKKTSVCANSYAIPGSYPIKKLRARAKPQIIYRYGEYWEERRVSSTQRERGVLQQFVLVKKEQL